MAFPLSILSNSIQTQSSKTLRGAIAVYVEEQSSQIQQIEAVALADSEQATWIDGEAVGAWLDSWGN